MYKSENLRSIINTGNKNVYFYYNDDASTVTSSGFFNDVRLSLGDWVIVYNGSQLIDYKVSAASGNSKTISAIRDVHSLGYQFQQLQQRVPVGPKTAGTYVLTCSVNAGGTATYTWESTEE